MGSSMLLTSPSAADLALTGGGSVGKVALVGNAGGLSGVLNFYDVLDANWAITGHRLDLHDASGAYVRTLASDSITAGWVGYVTEHNGTVYVGRTSTGSDVDNHRIDAVDLSASGATFDASTKVATLMYGYDLQFDSNGDAYASHNPGGFSPLTQIVRADLSGNDAHEVIVDVGGYAAELAFDAADNLHYGTNSLAADKLLRFDAELLDDGVTLGLADADVLSNLPSAGDGLAVDAAGNVVFSMNDYSSWPYSATMGVVWAGKDYSAYGDQKFDVLSGAGGSVSNVMTLGDVSLYDGSLDNAAFGVGYGGPVGYVPEPACMAALAMGAAALVRRRRTGGTGCSQPVFKQ